MHGQANGVNGVHPPSISSTSSTKSKFAPFADRYHSNLRRWRSTDKRQILGIIGKIPPSNHPARKPFVGANTMSSRISWPSMKARSSISHANLGVSGVSAVAKGLQENKQCFQTRLSLNLWSNELDDAGAQAIGDGLKVNTSLATLILYNNNIGDAGATAISKALQDHTSITSVDLRGNDFSVESGSALAAVAKQSPRIKEICGIPLDSLRDNKTTELNLKSKNLGPAEAAMLAEFLKVNASLTEISLWDNGIGDAGASAIGRALEENKTVIKLRMGANKIGPAGAEAIANMLKVNTALQVLNLYGNNIGSEGAAAIADMLKLLQLALLVRLCTQIHSSSVLPARCCHWEGFGVPPGVPHEQQESERTRDLKVFYWVGEFGVLSVLSYQFGGMIMMLFLALVCRFNTYPISISYLEA
eukprot:g9010.t1